MTAKVQRKAHKRQTVTSNRERLPLRILVTAGPTREPIDPVRFISNPSTGNMGYCIAKTAKDRGHRVTLISGPTHLNSPEGLRFISVTTARQMKEAVERNFEGCDCLIMASAVSDYRPSRYASSKLKSRRSEISLKLIKNPDVLYQLGKRKCSKILVGFALETEDLIENALSKLERKNLDLIVANQLGREGSVFGKGRVSCVIIDREAMVENIPKSSKDKISRILLKRIEGMGVKEG